MARYRGFDLVPVDKHSYKKHSITYSFITFLSYYIVEVAPFNLLQILYL